MGLSAPAYQVVHPNYMIPELILPYAQASGAFDLLATGDMLIRLGEGDQYVYGKRIDLRTRMAAGQSSYNELPSVSAQLSMISTPTYLMRVRAEYDHHDTAAGGRWAVSVPELHRLGMRQGHFQLARGALLYGMNPENGEGLLNSNGATAVKTRTNQLGIGRQFTITGPQRVLGQMEYNVVQLVQYQRIGAGTASTAGTVKEILMSNGDKIAWTYDDTLIGKGAGGNDAIIIAMPEVQRPVGAGRVNTNVFAELQPGLEACTLMLADMAAPREIPVPLAGGAVDVLSEWRITSGWPIRPEALTIVSAQYQ